MKNFEDHVGRSEGEDSFHSSEASSRTDVPLSTSVDTSGVGSSGGNSSFSGEVGLTERLTDILVEDGDSDLLMQRSDREDRVLQWLQALDMQVIGACRADERLKPLLKANASGGVAEDRLLAQLIQHFEPSEVGILARCFCIPLVSIRVGKVNKQGTLLCPTASRGNLSLTMLPTSDLRLSFFGDDGRTEKLSTLSIRSQCTAVVIKEIPADNSGRSFLVKIPNGREFYFWCAEKSKLLGIELLSKMKDIILKKPSVAELTGISESRLSCFATQLRVYLAGSVASSSWSGSSVLPAAPADDTSETDTQSGQFSATSRPLRARHVSQAQKSSTAYQASLSPRPSSFKEGLTRNLSSSLRTTAREKLRRRGDSYLITAENLTVASVENDAIISNQVENGSLGVISCPLASNVLESLGEFAVPPISNSASKVSSVMPPLFSPYYCWCPPDSMQCLQVHPEFPTSSAEPFSLPPLSSLLPASGCSSLLKATPSLDLASFPPLDLPAFLPDPLVHLPIAASQQIPTFTPFICDPIVHIPIVDVCSSGPGYLVSAGPAISTSISPLHSKLVGPLLPAADSVLDKSARETLRLLISSSTSQSSPALLDVLPAVLTSSDEKPGILVTGSRGLYSGTRDVNIISENVAFMGLASNFLSSSMGNHLKRCEQHESLATDLVGSSGGGDESCSEGDASQPFYRESADV